MRPGSYPLWGLTYYRWWLVDRLLEGAPVYLLSGCSLYVWWLRALGARVGNDVIIGSMTLRAPDLLALGDNVSIGNAVNFENARVERGQLVLGHIDVANDACIASFSVLEGGTRVGATSHLEGQSALPDGASVPPGRVWGGSPARTWVRSYPSCLSPPQSFSCHSCWARWCSSCSGSCSSRPCSSCPSSPASC
ncbi:hypothetical protein LP420_41590 [Massilia sp. B-10]|nr:hypothetical protein LP420_41590 [Massilia sp. B-10]